MANFAAVVTSREQQGDRTWVIPVVLSEAKDPAVVVKDEIFAVIPRQKPA